MSEESHPLDAHGLLFIREREREREGQVHVYNLFSFSQTVPEDEPTPEQQQQQMMHLLRSLISSTTTQQAPLPPPSSAPVYSAGSAQHHQQQSTGPGPAHAPVQPSPAVVHGGGGNVPLAHFDPPSNARVCESVQILPFSYNRAVFLIVWVGMGEGVYWQSQQN